MMPEFSNTATTETNTHGTQLSGDTTQDGLCTGLDLAEMSLLTFNGGKIPGTDGEWTSKDTMMSLDN